MPESEKNRTVFNGLNIDGQNLTENNTGEIIWISAYQH